MRKEDLEKQKQVDFRKYNVEDVASGPDLVEAGDTVLETGPRPPDWRQQRSAQQRLQLPGKLHDGDQREGRRRIVLARHGDAGLVRFLREQRERLQLRSGAECGADPDDHAGLQHSP